MKRRILVTAFAVTLSVLLVSCSSGSSDESGGDDGSSTDQSSVTAGDFAETVAKAEEEGKVTLYTSQFPDRLAEFEKAFEAKYDIDLVVVRANDSDNIPRLETEHKTGRVADVWVAASETVLIDKVDEGEWFVPAIGPNLDDPAYERAENYRDGDYFVVGGVPVVLGWNTDLVPDGLTDLADLLDPSLANGKIGLVEPLAPVQVDLYKWMDATFGDGYVEKLAKQNPRIYPSTIPMGQALASGEIAASPGVLPQEDEAANGAPVASTLSPKGFWSTPYYGAVLAGSPNPYAAQVLVDYMVSAEGQDLINRGLLGARRDGEGVLAVVVDAHQPDNDSLGAEEAAEYLEWWRGIFQS